jgi:sugar phosphate permease
LIGLGSFGFCQFSFFPALITIFSSYFNVKKEGSLVGFWSSKSNAGNILGFFMANFLVYQLHVKW